MTHWINNCHTITFSHTDFGLAEIKRKNQKENKRQKAKGIGMQLELFRNSACQHCLLLLLCKDSCNTTASFLSSTEDSCQQKYLLYLYFYSNNYNLCVNKLRVFAGFLMPSVLSCSHTINLKHLCVTKTTSRITNIKKKSVFDCIFHL